MELRKVDMEVFKKVIYPEYVKIFPELERKTYQDLKKAYERNIMNIIGILWRNNW